MSVGGCLQPSSSFWLLLLIVWLSIAIVHARTDAWFRPNGLMRLVTVSLRITYRCEET
jgi:hypothetical protein